MKDSPLSAIIALIQAYPNIEVTWLYGVHAKSSAKLATLYGDIRQELRSQSRNN
jgi:hypothetical protein